MEENKKPSAIQQETEGAVVEALKENLLPYVQKFLNPAFKELSSYMTKEVVSFHLMIEDGEMYFIKTKVDNLADDMFKDNEKLSVFRIEDFVKALIQGDFESAFGEKKDE